MNSCVLLSKVFCFSKRFSFFFVCVCVYELLTELSEIDACSFETGIKLSNLYKSFVPFKPFQLQTSHHEKAPRLGIKLS